MAPLASGEQDIIGRRRHLRKPVALVSVVVRTGLVATLPIAFSAGDLAAREGGIYF